MDVPDVRADDSSPNLIVEYYRSVVRHRRLIFLLALAGVLASVLLHIHTQPVYRTRTSLDIQSINADFLTMRSSDPTGASSSETNVQTQIRLLQSESLMDRVKQRLTNEPHPEYVQKTDLLSRLQRMVRLGGSETISFQALLEETARGVGVKPLGITRLVEVTCDSWDAAFAARFCNTLTNEFQVQDLESRGTEAKHTSDWLMRQASDIRQKAEDSEERLHKATGGDGMILSQNGNSVGEDHLRQLQSELVKAQADRMEKEAEASVASTSTSDSTPSVVNTVGYAAAQTKLADLQAQVAALVPPLTEANPRVIHLRSQIRAVQETLAKASLDSRKRLDNEYSAARHREALLAMAYKAQEANVSSDLEKGSKVALLRREMESEQQLYQTLLQRAKEAGFASAMQASTIRVVGAARVPRFPVYPQRASAASVGLILGAAMALVIAFFTDRNIKVMRVPGESAEFLQLRELGVIPSPTRSRILGLKSDTHHLTTVNLTKPADQGSLEAVRWNDSFSLVAEAYRNATLSLLLSDRTQGSRAYVVTSAGANEGKTTVTANLGVALSKSKLKVCLIDGDLRKPSLHRILSTSNDVGLRNILRGEVDLRTTPTKEYCRPTAFPKLSVLPSGRGEGEVVELLHSSDLDVLLDKLYEDFDIVLVDSPPVLHMVDARIIARHTSGAILIMRSGLTTREEALHARDMLLQDRVPVVGTILNDFDAAKEGKSKYYGSYYAYQHRSESFDQEVVRS